MTDLLAAVGANGQQLALPPVEYSKILPLLILAVGAMALLLGSSLVRERISAYNGALVTVVLGLVTMATTIWLWDDLSPDKGGPVSALAGSVAFDHFSIFFVVVLSTALVLSALVSADWLAKRGHSGPEYFVLMLLSTSGAVLMASANDLIVIFLGLEILSIALYVLVGFDRESEGSREGAMKYFILGGFSSAIFLYGIALTYGATGTTNLSGIAAFLAQNTVLEDGLLLSGVALLAVGFAFKIAAVPFHQWTPDVYQGSPTPVVGFMAAAAKAGAFAALLRVFAGTFASLELDWKPLVLAIVVLTLFVGAVVACVQKNVKRMLAYSSISHAGFILLGLYASNLDGISSSLYYLLVYTFMVAGTFAIVAIVEDATGGGSTLETFRGLSRHNPGLALALTALLLAQVGFPLTSGFLAKFYVMSALVQNGSYALALFAMLTAAIAAFFYLRIVVVMYTSNDDGDSRSTSEVIGRVEMPGASGIAVAVSVLFTLGLGVLPSGDYMFDAITFARQAANDLFPQASSSGQ